jgi:hypothetical protein
MPEIPKGRPKTDRQFAFTERSVSAQAFAKFAMADPELKKYYESKVSKTNSAFNVAFKDFQTKPYVREIDTKNYIGTAGSEIVVKAYKDGSRILEARMRIDSAAGALIEEGPAVINNAKGGNWIYTATQNNPVLPGTRITVTVKDIPQNEVVLEKTL